LKNAIQLDDLENTLKMALSQRIWLEILQWLPSKINSCSINFLVVFRIVCYNTVFKNSLVSTTVLLFQRGNEVGLENWCKGHFQLISNNFESLLFYDLIKYNFQWHIQFWVSFLSSYKYSGKTQAKSRKEGFQSVTSESVFDALEPFLVSGVNSWPNAILCRSLLLGL